MPSIKNNTNSLYSYTKIGMVYQIEPWNGNNFRAHSFLGVLWTKVTKLYPKHIDHNELIILLHHFQNCCFFCRLHKKVLWWIEAQTEAISDLNLQICSNLNLFYLDGRFDIFATHKLMVQFYNETVWTIKINAKIWLGTLVCNLLIWWYIIWFILSHIMGVQSILVGNETWISHSLAQKKKWNHIHRWLSNDHQYIVVVHYFVIYISSIYWSWLKI